MHDSILFPFLNVSDSVSKISNGIELPILLTFLDMKTIRVSAAVIKDGDKILTTERGYGKYKGFWEFPGGKREEGESGEETIVREIREELETTIAVDSFLCTIEHQYEDFYLIMDCYLCHIVEGNITIKEHKAMKWITSEMLESVDWLPADIKALPSVRSALGW